jgi:hypothetical protein
VDGYWVEPDPDVYERIAPYWVDFETVFVPAMKQRKWKMWVDRGVEFFIHPAMRAAPGLDFPTFFREDREGRPRGLIRMIKDRA